MNLLKILLLSIFVIDLQAQDNLQSVRIDHSLGINNYSREELDSIYFNLPEVEYSDFKFYIRFRKISQIVDLYSNDGVSFNGRLINEITQLKSSKTDGYRSSVPSKYIYEIVDLDSEVSGRVGEIILKKKIIDIPTDTLIKDWNRNWLDCPGITFIIKAVDEFSISKYSCPLNQNDSIQYAKIIKNVYLQIDSILDLKQKYIEFKNRLKKGKHYTNGFVRTYVMTGKQAARWKKLELHRRYMESVKDTVDRYLESRLNELLSVSDIEDCFNEYYLTFSSDGKLKKIKIIGYNSFIERFSDKNGRKCKRVIKNAFQKIQINFIHPEYEFTKRIGLYNNKVKVYD